MDNIQKGAPGMFLSLKNKVEKKRHRHKEHPKINITSDNIGKLNCHKTVWLKHQEKAGPNKKRISKKNT